MYTRPKPGRNGLEKIATPAVIKPVNKGSFVTWVVDGFSALRHQGLPSSQSE